MRTASEVAFDVIIAVCLMSIAAVLVVIATTLAGYDLVAGLL